jgi:hypothetical protein
MKYGKGIVGSVLKDFLNNSYSKNQAQQLHGFKRDDALSGQRGQVYHNDATNQTYVINRGTSGLQDWITDAKLLFFPKLYMQSTRYNHAKDIQENAESKYGKENITTLGHSLGAKLSSDLGGHSKEIISYNRPILPYEILNQTRKNETSVRTRLDPVSILGSVNPKIKQISTKTINPITAHNLEQLDNIKDEIIGQGETKLSHLKKGGLTNFELFDICKRMKIPLANVISKDEIHEITKNGNYIVNLENHNQNGSHWTALQMTAKNCLYMDSFGMPPPEKLFEYLEKKYKKVNYNRMVIQDMDSSFCGYFCIAFFKLLSTARKNKKANKSLLKVFQRLFSPNTKENDGILADFLS